MLVAGDLIAKIYYVMTVLVIEEHNKSGELELVYPAGSICKSIKNTGHSWKVEVFQNEELGKDSHGSHVIL